MRNHLLRPGAIVSHLLVMAVAITCVLLGQWQLDRLGEVRANNDRLAERLERDPVDLATLATDEVDVDGLEFRRVEVSGTYRSDEEVLQRGQQHQQQQGFHVLTPLEVGADTVVLVRRGWVPARLSEPPVAEAAPPTGEVSLTGILERPVEQPGFGPRDPDEGRLDRVFHTDTSRLDHQVEGALFPMVLRLDAPADAAFDDLPVGVERPVLDEANHLSYALQWFSFALLAIVTYGAWLWTRWRRDRGGDEHRRGRDGDDGESDAHDDEDHHRRDRRPTSSGDSPADRARV